jgi:hypothetical protein
VCAGSSKDYCLEKASAGTRIKFVPNQSPGPCTLARMSRTDVRRPGFASCRNHGAEGLEVKREKIVRPQPLPYLNFFVPCVFCRHAHAKMFRLQVARKGSRDSLPSRVFGIPSIFLGGMLAESIYLLLIHPLPSAVWRAFLTKIGKQESSAQNADLYESLRKSNLQLQVVPHQ